MGLGPAPEEIKLLDWGKPYGLLPSRFTSDDYRWLALAEATDHVRRLNTLWENYETARRFSPDAALYIVEKRKKARKLMEDLGFGDQS